MLSNYIDPKKYRIVFVFDKIIGETCYKEPMMEIKEGLFAEMWDEFPEDLKFKTMKITN